MNAIRPEVSHVPGVGREIQRRKSITLLREQNNEKGTTRARLGQSARRVWA